MSIRALLKGVEKRLRSEGVFDDQPGDEVGAYIGIQPSPGTPPKSAGQWYAALHWAGGRGNDRMPTRHDVYHGVVVTLTARLNYAPRDRQGIRLTTVGDVYDLVDQIAGPNVIHGNVECIQFANEFITGTAEWGALQSPVQSATVNGFLNERLVVGPFGPERTAPSGWVGADAAKDVYVIDIKFDLARRMQSNE